MNIVMLTGRLVSDPMVNTSSEHSVARYRLAVERRVRRDAPEGTPTADFISCVVFGKGAEFTDKYMRKGMKMIVRGHIQTGKYEKDGQTIYTTDVVVEDQEFAESKRQDGQNDTAQQQSAPAPSQAPAQTAMDNSWMNVPADAEGDLPFN